jgi:hypothetical protein
MCNCKQYEDDSHVSPFEQAQRTGNKETVAFEGALFLDMFGWEVFMVGGWSGVATTVIILTFGVLVVLKWGTYIKFGVQESD